MWSSYQVIAIMKSLGSNTIPMFVVAYFAVFYGLIYKYVVLYNKILKKVELITYATHKSFLRFILYYTINKVSLITFPQNSIIF